ncbi:hypothetical protein GCM10023219_15020 [Stakelama sediminis]|uniref:Uncharacterized protein n=1 Tax=Stakelama sediminis TaxID=463200 RepID=A0A840YWX7_9SPHN|nr:ribonuclease [Stakelama sediminis]MBB5718231.1 hypothetical protein [Stakelama sediminis]
MAEWWVERGIGEARAVLVEQGRIAEARILPDTMLLAGSVLEARLVRRIPARNQGIIAWPDGEALLSPLPRSVTEGATLPIEITRPPLPEPGKPKRALARPAAADAKPGGRPDPLAGLNGPVRILAWQDSALFDGHGWAELCEEAETRSIAFPGGGLTLSLTPAMTLFDVDGELPAFELAQAGAAAAARAIRRLDIGGSIGIDLPTVADKAQRLAIADAIDANLPQPFERTAVNGFGFVQIVRRRARLSLPELHAGDPQGWYARALLRQAERSTGTGERILAAHPAVLEAIEAIPDWRGALEQRMGAQAVLRADPALAISAGHVQARFP